PARLKIAECLSAPTSADESQTANAPLRHRKQALPERTRVKAIADAEPRSLGFKLARRHGLNVDEQVVQPPGTRKAGVVSCVEHAVRPLEQLLGMFQGQELNEALGADPRPAAEQSLKMELAQVHA